MSNSVLDQRIANVAVIISITLVVVGFLINNLAVKEIFTFRLLFKYTFLYPIIYFCLSVIGLFFLLAAIREELSSHTFKNMVLAGTYLSVLIIILVGFLFSVLIKFSDDNQVQNLMNKELLLEAEEKLIMYLRVIYSGSVYTECLKSGGAEIYDFFESFDISDITFREPSKTPSKFIEERSYIYDIKIGSIEKRMRERLKKKPLQKILFKSTRFGDYIVKSESYIWQSPVIDSFFENKLKKYFLLKEKDKFGNTKEEVKNYFQLKLKESVHANKAREVHQILNSILELYKMEMENLEKI